jgi:hypothetical protein
VAREMVVDALARYGRPTPNAIRALAIWLHTYSHHRLTPALGAELAAGPREG